MQDRHNASLVFPLAGHFAMGAMLGIALALALLATQVGLFDMIAASAAPRLTMAMLVGVFAAVFAVGATLTGWIFLATERG